MGGGEWSRLELGGGGWSWLELGARFSNTHKKILGFYMHANISRTSMIFDTEIFLHEVAKSINSQTNNKSSIA